MTTKLVLVALLWGTVGGFLILHTFVNLLAVGFCLHGLLMTRWKRLAKKVTIGAVKYSINLKVLLQVASYALLSVALLQMGDEYVRREFRYAYFGNQLVIAGLAAFAVIAVSLKSVCRRLTDIWKMSHQFDYAERRQRTRMLKS